MITSNEYEYEDAGKKADLHQFGPIFAESTSAGLVKAFCRRLVKIGPNW